MTKLCRIYTVLWAFVFAFILPSSLDAQIKIIPKEKLDSIVNPTLAPISKLLSFDKIVLDAGTIAENGGLKTYYFDFSNISDEDVEIKRLVTNCSCVVAYALPQVVKAGHKSTIKVLYDPKGHPGKFVRTLRVYASRLNSEDKLALAAFLKLKVHVTEN